MKVAIAILLASTVPAASYTSSDGHQYDLTCTADGYSLKATYPVSRFIGRGAATRIVTERETLALGRSCDAHLDSSGYGEWCWANGGVRADFPDGEIVAFPLQELGCSAERDYEGNCRC